MRREFSNLLVRGVCLSDVDALDNLIVVMSYVRGTEKRGISGIAVYDDRVYTCLYVSEEG